MLSYLPSRKSTCPRQMDGTFFKPCLYMCSGGQKEFMSAVFVRLLRKKDHQEKLVGESFLPQSICCLLREEKSQYLTINIAHVCNDNLLGTFSWFQPVLAFVVEALSCTVPASWPLHSWTPANLKKIEILIFIECCNYTCNDLSNGPDQYRPVDLPWANH